MRQITREEWREKKRHGFASTIDGVKHILTWGEKGTTLEPVEVQTLKQEKEDIEIQRQAEQEFIEQWPNELRGKL